MIIRRRHTTNFTTIGNALFDDERLAADELGILAWLLSRPHDWEVRRPALMRRHHVGRDALKRIVTNWMRTGWCQAKKTRLSNGTFHVIYEIRDEPGRELTDEDIRVALSSVSGEAADDESDSENAPDQPPPTGDPPTPKPGVDDQGVAGRTWPIEDSLNPESPRTDSTKIVRDFSVILSKWPAEHVLSRVVCERMHAGLTDADQEAAVKYAGPYVSDRAANGAKLCDLKTYYEGRRWERLAQKSAAVATQFHVRPHTPQAYRWREYLERAEPQKLRMFDLMMSRNGFTAPGEWPPPLPPKAPEISAADIEELTK